MDFFDIIFGRGLLEAIGGVIRFAFGYCYAFLLNKEHKSLSFYFTNEKDEIFSNSAGNHVVGVIFFGIIVLITIIAIS